MPLDDYAAVGGGALRLKGAKVGKSKKKKKDKKALSAALETAASDDAEASLSVVKADDLKKEKKKDNNKNKDRAADDDEAGAGASEADDDNAGESFKTEAQRRFEEAKRKKFLDLTKSAASNPELLKTHKERVDELNHFLSKLSEHNDMPKIGPG